MTYKEAVFVDMGGVIMMPEPTPLKYLLDKGLSGLPLREAGNEILNAVRKGEIVSKEIEGVRDGLERLSERYGLAVFSHGHDHDEIVRTLLDQLSVRDLFPTELIVPQFVFYRGLKSNSQSWGNANDYLMGKGYYATAFLEDDLAACEAAIGSNLEMDGFFVSPQSSGRVELPCGENIPVGDLSRAADYLLRDERN